MLKKLSVERASNEINNNEIETIDHKEHVLNESIYSADESEPAPAPRPQPTRPASNFLFNKKII